MGTFKWPLRISSMDGQRVWDMEATVDTGASFTTLPSSLLRELGIEPMGKRGFLLADSWRIEMDYGEARARDALLPRLLSGQVTVGRGS